MKFKWHVFWLSGAITSLVLGALFLAIISLFLAIIFGLAAWSCWPDR